MIKFKCQKLKTQPWKTFIIEAKLNLVKSVKNPEWISVQLLFVIPKSGVKNEFALFLTTDMSLSKEKILEIYSLRWGIEVYFKEVKQNLGFLREQTGNFACHYASIHLSAIRYLLFFEIMQHQGAQYFGKVRDGICAKLEYLTFASLLWELFKNLIYGILDQFQEKLGNELLDEMKESLNSQVTKFLTEALQLDSATLKAEAIES